MPGEVEGARSLTDPVSRGEQLYFSTAVDKMS